MRLLITKFMLTNVGLGWTKERVPTDVQQSINSNNSDANYLNNVDFIQLKNFLFSENYPNHKDSLIKKLKSAKDFTNLELEEIKSLLPESNWDRFFQPLVGCEADFLKKRWDQLYELRCKVAHNKDFNHTNLEDVLKLTAELKPILDKALVSLDDIVISEDEKDDVFENVLTFYDSTFAKYMVRIQRLEQLLNIILERFGASAKNPHPMSLLELQKYVASMGILTDKQLQVMDKVRKVRNKIAHETFGTEAHEVIESQLELEKLIMQLEVVVKKL
ncbi:TPA: hypothetical protein P0E18_005195 [Vibrio harveyi]|nr:hypothetical protein [Vibrio harveyi]